MPNATTCNPRLFADDTYSIEGYSTLSGLERECDREMEKLHKWCYANELQIHSKKSEALVIPSQLSAPKTDLIISYIDGPINCLKHQNTLA